MPCFVVCDYEHAELGIYRRFGATILHPSVVSADFFEARGFRRDRLISFDGLKEDISFADLDIGSVVPHDFGPNPEALIRVLLRPPAEISHYFHPESKQVMLALYRHLADRDDVLTIFSPRYPSQIADLEAMPWRRQPIVLRDAIPFLSLLKAVDRVVSAGGTMIREAAYLGIPAYSLFASELGAVDAYLEQAGHLTVLRSEAEMARVTERVVTAPPFPRRPMVRDEIAETVIAAAATNDRSR